MYCIRLDHSAGTDRIGGKAAHLAWAASLGFRVPDTIVVTREALGRFIAHHHLDSTLAAYHRTARTSGHLEAAFDRLAARVRTCNLPDDLRVELSTAIAAILPTARAGLAVRSSAIYEDSDAASFAGVFESTIGVQDIDQAVRAVIACWLSAWTPRALRYLDRMAIEPVIDSMAVMIQPVVQATSAGVIVTANPDTGNPWEFVLHAARGLSVDLMSGSGAGDRYHLDWETGAVRDQHLAGNVAILSPVQYREVADAARHLDEAASKRMDVEWALADGLWILQARPLTALPQYQPPEIQRHVPGEQWQRAPFLLPLRSDLPTGFLTPFYADLSESELWYRYQPDDIVLTGIWRRETDLNGYRYVDAGPRPNFSNHLSSVADFETWLDRNEARYRDRWDQRHDELAAIETIARSALRDITSAAALVPATIEVRDHLWDLNSFGWSGPQALGWMCEAMLGRYLQPIDPLLRVSALIGGEESYTFALAAALQDLGRSIQDERVRAALRDEPLDKIIPALQDRAPDCDFLRDYESHCSEQPAHRHRLRHRSCHRPRPYCPSAHAGAPRRAHAG